MNRKYKIEDYIDKITKLKNLVPGLNLTTDIIVGFPGETSSDFQDTLNLMKTVEFDDAYMYKYNTRENTYSSDNFADDVSDEEKLERLQTIIDLQIEIRKKKKTSRIGDIFEVIPERKSKNNQNEILGLTKEDLMIIYNSPDFEIGKIVKLKAVKLTGNSLFGERV
jgi:tRNA-2-methylthio-N6-dimethylallyladenosine synthase